MQTQTNEIEEQLATAKQAVARAEALERLKKNKDFKAVILQEFMVDACANFESIGTTQSHSDTTTDTTYNL